MSIIKINVVVVKKKIKDGEKILKKIYFGIGVYNIRFFRRVKFSLCFVIFGVRFL